MVREFLAEFLRSSSQQMEGRKYLSKCCDVWNAVVHIQCANVQCRYVSTSPVRPDSNDRLFCFRFEATKAPLKKRTMLPLLLALALAVGDQGQWEIWSAVWYLEGSTVFRGSAVFT